MRAKNSIKRGTCHIGGNYKRAKKRKQKRGAIPFGLIASLARPVLGEVAKPIFKKNNWKRSNKKEKERMVKQTIIE